MLFVDSSTFCALGEDSAVKKSFCLGTLLLDEGVAPFRTGVIVVGSTKPFSAGDDAVGIDGFFAKYLFMRPEAT